MTAPLFMLNRVQLACELWTLSLSREVRAFQHIDLGVYPSWRDCLLHNVKYLCKVIQMNFELCRVGA